MDKAKKIKLKILCAIKLPSTSLIVSEARGANEGRDAKKNQIVRPLVFSCLAHWVAFSFQEKSDAFVGWGAQVDVVQQKARGMTHSIERVRLRLYQSFYVVSQPR